MVDFHQISVDGGAQKSSVHSISHVEESFSMKKRYHIAIFQDVLKDLQNLKKTKSKQLQINLNWSEFFRVFLKELRNGRNNKITKIERSE